MQSYRNPAATWLASPNFTLDRNGHDMAIQPAYIILHTTVGFLAAAEARFLNPTEQASAHYIVGYNGSLTQMVDEKDAAWHAGNFTCNLDSIGIEHEDEGRYNDPRPDALYATSAQLVAAICKRYAIPCDRAHIRPHKEVSDTPTACPDALDIDRIIRQAQGGSMTTRRALVRLAYRAGLGREPASVADIDAWANTPDDDETMVMKIIDSVEGVAYTAKVNAALGATAPADVDPFSTKGHTHKLVCVTDPDV